MGSIINSAPWWTQLLFFLGVTVGIVTLVFLTWAIASAIEELIKKLIYIYKYKHRFGKLPTAKCYCKDCDNWHPHSPQATEGTCWAHASWYTADNWFCWSAEPRDTERK